MFMLPLLAVGYVAIASAAPSLPVNPGGIGGLFKGPNSETIIKGPDGSVITAAAEGGEVVSNLEPIVVAEPIVQEVAPVVVQPAPAIEAVAVPPAAVDSKLSSDLIGPSGRISTQGSSSIVAGPASTTVSGPAVVGTSVIKGPPIVAPVVDLTPPLAVVPAATAVPLATVTASPIPLNVNLASSGLVGLGIASPSVATLAGSSPVAVTPAPILVNSGLGRPIGVGPIISSTIATASGAPSIAVTAAPHAVATASVSPQLTVATASAINGASATASAIPLGVTAAPIPLPLPSSTVIPGIGPGFSGINQEVDLRPQLIPDQIAVDNRQFNLNPALIPAGNIIPPEISVTPRIPIGRLRPTPGTLLTTPGLGTVANTPNIQREEASILPSVTPNIVQANPQLALTTQQILQLQNQQNLYTNQIQNTQPIRPVTLGVTPSTFQLSPDQLSGLQNQRNLLNPQIQHTEAAVGQGGVTPIASGNPRLFAPTGTAGTNQISLANVQQQELLSSELAKSGIDASQLQLTNVPLSAVSGLAPANLNKVGINDGLALEAWGRYGRDAETKRKS